MAARRAAAGASASASAPFDSIVVGLGAHGSAALHNLAKWGDRVLGLERFGVGHARGSHHGLTRITRMAYMVRRAAGGAAAAPSCLRLYHSTGVLNIGDPVCAAAAATAAAHGLHHELLTGRQAAARFPGLSLPDDMPVLFERAGGILEPEKMVQAHVAVAQHHGAVVRTGERVLAWQATPGGGVEVTTDQGSYSARSLVLAGGAWMHQLVPELAGLAVPGRATVAWFQPSRPRLYAADRLPVFILQDSELGCFYGFPEFGGKPGLKIGRFSVSEDTEPDALARELRPSDLAPLAQAVGRYLPGAVGPVLDFGACLFSMTPDNHFIIDTHPRHPQVVLCSACSGHGFKLSPAVGLALAELARHGRCSTFEAELAAHKLDRRRPGHAAVLDRFERPQRPRQQPQPPGRSSSSSGGRQPAPGGAGASRGAG